MYTFIYIESLCISAFGSCHFCHFQPDWWSHTLAQPRIRQGHPWVVWRPCFNLVSLWPWRFEGSLETQRNRAISECCKGFSNNSQIPRTVSQLFLEYDLGKLGHLSADIRFLENILQQAGDSTGFCRYRPSNGSCPGAQLGMASSP